MHVRWIWGFNVFMHLPKQHKKRCLLWNAKLQEWFYFEGCTSCAPHQPPNDYVAAKTWPFKRKIVFPKFIFHHCNSRTCVRFSNWVVCTRWNNTFNIQKSLPDVPQGINWVSAEPFQGVLMWKSSKKTTSMKIALVWDFSAAAGAEGLSCSHMKSRDRTPGETDPLLVSSLLYL